MLFQIVHVSLHRNRVVLVVFFKNGRRSLYFDVRKPSLFEINENNFGIARIDIASPGH